jgi:hypothetical protein
MGFNQSSSAAKVVKVAKNDLLGAVVSGCLAGLGIWTKPSSVITPDLPPPSPTSNNVYPLRVIRVKDENPQLAGRMVISGRMSDVCAELDRLAA